MKTLRQRQNSFSSREWLDAPHDRDIQENGGREQTRESLRRELYGYETGKRETIH